ncbi:MAG: alanine racemase [Anaerolineales bacterium]|nr:alanine racemase [Anaerolineales bacterium]
MKAEQSFATWVEVDLNILKKNIKILQNITGIPLMAVVKANGYGHGFIPVTKTAEEAGVNWFGVARPRMALKMREEGIKSNILMLGYIAPERIEQMICLDVSLTVWTREQINKVINAALNCQTPARIHLLVDSGMGRLGCMPEETLELAKIAAESDQIIFEGFFTHLARADEIDPEPTLRQHKVFTQLIQELDDNGVLPGIIHMANSAGSLAHPETHYDLIRPGIIIYGLAPSADVQLPEGIKPVLSWKSVLAGIKELPPDHGISYGHAYVTTQKELIGVIPVGYADGFRRIPGGEVLINGVKAPIVGRVCMDQFMVKLEGIPNPQVGDEVILVGKQGDLEISANDLADLWQTINYEGTCGIGARVPRIYPDNPER